MSTEAVKKFWQKASQDKALEAKLAAIQVKERQATVATLVKLAAEAGFPFTPQEYDAAVKEELAKQHAAGELSQQELESVAGGFHKLNVPYLVSVIPHVPSITPCRQTEGPACAGS